MSGRKQHFIPQSLLKGFGRAGKGTKVQVVVYTYDRGIFRAATDGIAAEREFYSKLSVEGEGGALDDKITAYETLLATTLSTFRSLANEEEVDNNRASEFVTHLVVRNDHLRKLMSSAGRAIFDGFAEAMSDKDRAQQLLGLGGDEPTERFAEQMRDVFGNHAPLIGMLGMSRDQFTKWAFSQTRANFASFHAQLIEPLRSVFSEATSEFAERTADAHRRSLVSSLSPAPRVDKMKEFEWRIIHVARPLVLPDCVAIAFDAKGDAFPLLIAELDQAETIYLPLSADRLLVGSKKRSQTPDDLNEVLASCGWDFFVASDRTPELEAVRSKIRGRTGKYVSDTINDSITGALEDRNKKSERPDPSNH